MISRLLRDIMETLCPPWCSEWSLGYLEMPWKCCIIQRTQNPQTERANHIEGTGDEVLSTSLWGGEFIQYRKQLAKTPPANIRAAPLEWTLLIFTCWHGKGRKCQDSSWWWNQKTVILKCLECPLDIVMALFSWVSWSSGEPTPNRRPPHYTEPCP